MNQESALEISWGTILRVTLAVFCLYLVFLVRDILVLSVFGLIISVLFETPIRFLERKIPRVLATVFVYVLAFSFLIALIYIPAFRFMFEIRQFVSFLPAYFEKIAPPLRGLGVEAFKEAQTFTEALENIIQASAANIFNVLLSFFGGISTTIFVISISVFLSLEGKDIEKNLVLIFPKRDENFVISLWRKAQKKVGLWFLTSIASCFFIGIASFFTFYLIGTKYPLLLGIIAGTLNFVPVIGSIFAAFLIFIVLILDSTTKALFAFVAFIIIQQIENNIISPFITKKFVGLSPPLILVGLTIGGRLFGVLGAILTVPLIGMFTEILKGLLERKKVTGEF